MHFVIAHESRSPGDSYATSATCDSPSYLSQLSASMICMPFCGLSRKRIYFKLFTCTPKLSLTPLYILCVFEVGQLNILCVFLCLFFFVPKLCLLCDTDTFLRCKPMTLPNTIWSCHHFQIKTCAVIGDVMVH